MVATLYVTVRDEEPVAPLVTVIQEALLIADAVHPVSVVSATLPVAPQAETEAELGESAYAHAAAACVMVSVRPAIVITPVRDVATVLAATV